MSAGSDVELELARIKGEMPAGQPQQALAGRSTQERRGTAAGPEREEEVIVRILGEGQVDVPDGELDWLNALDDGVQAAVETGDEAAFAPPWHRSARPGARGRRPGAGRGDRRQSDLVLPVRRRDARGGARAAR